MLFERKSFMETVKAMAPDDYVLFRDSAEKGDFEVLCVKKTKYWEKKTLMKAVFHSEDSNIYSDDVGVIGEPFLANAQDVLSALAGKDFYAEYKNGLFDGVSVFKHGFTGNDDDSPYHKITYLRKSVKEFEKEAVPELCLTILAGQHQIITKNVKKFVSSDETRHFLNSVHFHFSGKNDIRVAATDGRSLAVYELSGEFDEAKKDSKYTVSPDMLFVPPFKYESAVYEFSKEIVRVTVRGKSSDPVISAYGVALEWMDLHNARRELNGLVNGDEEAVKGYTDVKKRIKTLKEEIEKYLEKGCGGANFPNYEKVIPENNPEKLTFSKEEICLALEKIKRYLSKSGSFIIEAVDENVCLTSYTDMTKWKGIEYIDTKLPLKKVTVTRPVRLVFNRDCFEKCCLEGADKTEFRMKDMRSAFLTEGVDFLKGNSVKVKKIFMPNFLPEGFGIYGEAPEIIKTTNEEDLAKINAENDD